MPTVVPLRPAANFRTLCQQLRRVLLGQASAAEALATSRSIAALSRAQRALLAAQVHHGARHGKARSMTITQAAAGQLVGSSQSSVSSALKILQGATAAEIRQVEDGTITIAALAGQLLRKVPRATRAKIAGQPRNQRGGHLQRIQRMRLHALVWRQLKAGLELTDLPQPSDVVAIARAHDKAGLVDAKLLRASQWLEEFVDEWTKPRR